MISIIVHIDTVLCYWSMIFKLFQKVMLDVGILVFAIIWQKTYISKMLQREQEGAYLMHFI